MNEKRLMNVKEAAEFLGVGVGTLYHWVSAGTVPHIKLSLRCLRFRREELERWVAEKAYSSVAQRSR